MGHPMIAKIIKIGLFLFILYAYAKYSVPIASKFSGITRLVFLGVSALVFLAMASKLFGGEGE